MKQNNTLLANKYKRHCALLDKVRLLPENEQSLILTKTINLLRQQLKKPVTDKTKKSIADKYKDNPLIEKYIDIFDQINAIGKPFIKCRKDPRYKTYKKTIALIAKHYSEHGYKIVDIFKLGHFYFNSGRFVFIPSKISLHEFFEHDRGKLIHCPSLNKYTTSWFREFSKGEKHIEKNFIRLLKDNYPSLTKDFVKIWQDAKNQKITKFDQNHCIIATKLSRQFAEKNNLATQTIFHVIKDYLDNNDFVDSVSFFKSEYFWQKELPKLLVDKNIFSSRREIK